MEFYFPIDRDLQRLSPAANGFVFVPVPLPTQPAILVLYEPSQITPRNSDVFDCPVLEIVLKTAYRRIAFHNGP